MGETFHQFTRFIGVGAVATLAHYALLIALVEAISADPVVASCVGALVGAIISYGLNRTLTFQSDRMHRSALPRFMVVAGLAMALNAVLMALLTGLGGLPYLVAQIITTICIVSVTYVGNKFWSFSPQGKH